MRVTMYGMLNKGSQTVNRFPFALFIAVLGSFSMIYFVDASEHGQNSLHFFFKFGFISALGISVFVAATVFAEQRGWDKIKILVLNLLALALLAGFYFILPEDLERSPNVHFVRYALFLLVSHLLVSFAPFIGRGSVPDFWNFNKSLFLRILLSALYSAALFFGLSAAILSVDKLFEINIDFERYLQLWIFMVGVFNTWFFLAGVPEPDQFYNVESDFPKGLRVFGQYILIPLVTVYIIILYFYTGKIIMEWEWPNGWVANLVLGFSVTGILSLLLLNPIKEDERYTWIRIYSKWYYIALIPLVVLLFMSIWVRISAYGITINRYFVVALACWLTGMVAYFLMSKEKSIKVIPISLFIISLGISAGPWGVFSVSERNQFNRMKAILEKNEILNETGEINHNHPEMPFDDRKEVGSIVNYLVDNHGYKKLQTLFTVNLDSTLSGDSLRWNNAKTQKIMALMDLEYVSPGANKDTKIIRFSYAADNKDLVNVSGYDLMLSSVSFTNRIESFICMDGEMEWLIRYDEAPRLIRIVKIGTGSELKIELLPKVEELYKNNMSGTYSLPQNELTLRAQNSDYKALVLIDNLMGEKNDSTFAINNITVSILIGDK